MHDSIASALRDWQSFYLLTGGAAATLAGLLFLTIQFGIGVEYPAGARSAIGTFVAPTFLRFVEVLVIAALALLPDDTRSLLGGLLLLLALVNAWSIFDLLRHSIQEYERHQLQAPHWIWNVSVPAGAGVLLLVAAVALLLNRSWALDSLAAATLALLVTALYSAWQVMTWVAYEQDRSQR